MKSAAQQYAEQVLAGERLSLARLLTLIENDDPVGIETLGLLFPHTGKAHLIGVTGAPGTGKSSLVNRIAHFFRKANGGTQSPTIAIVAVDPSSPFTGGAILGDRIRMRDLAGDPGIFIRSMASRGALGGLARMTADVVEALDAAGFDLILIETVGAGQAEVEIAQTAHSTVLVDAPGLGDDVQAIKAGLLEIADILVVNKADLHGAENTVRALRAALSLAHPTSRHNQEGENCIDDSLFWSPPVLSTVATRAEGIAPLADAIRQHQRFLQSSGELQRRERGRRMAQIEHLLREHLMAKFHANYRDDHYQELVEKVLRRELAPRNAVQILIEELQP